MRAPDYSVENVDKCWCGKCPVQIQSACATRMYEQASADLDQRRMPDDHKLLPGLYCATGKASCDDIEPVERCLCAQCLVWGENQLGSNHYCLQGSASEIGR